MVEVQQMAKRLFRLQLPENIREWLYIRAEANGRKPGAEAVQILKAEMLKSGMTAVSRS